MYFMAGRVSSLARYCLFSSTHSVKVIFAIYEKALHYCCKGMVSRDVVFSIQNKFFPSIICTLLGLSIFPYFLFVDVFNSENLSHT
jgi:hypothetical protein